jgi:hypothetical protein
MLNKGRIRELLLQLLVEILEKLPLLLAQTRNQARETRIPEKIQPLLAQTRNQARETRILEKLQLLLAQTRNQMQKTQQGDQKNRHRARPPLNSNRPSAQKTRSGFMHTHQKGISTFIALWPQSQLKTLPLTKGAWIH